MSDWSVGPSWQWSRWLKNYARNCRITEPTNVLPYAGELTRVRTLLKSIYNPMTKTGTRPWLKDAFQRKAVQVPTDTDYQCDIDQQPAHVLIVLLEIVGRDFKKIPVTAGEQIATGTLFTFAPARVFGSKYTYGNVGGSVVGVP
jgi:hypothetical protein